MAAVENKGDDDNTSEILSFLKREHASVPRDEENAAYVKSFSIEEVDLYKQFFDRFGFVVVRDVLTQQECEEAVDDIWKYIENRGWFKSSTLVADYENHEVKRDDPSTWSAGWPAMENEGIVAVPPVFTKSALSVRQNPKVYKVFADLLNNEDLLVNHDRYGLFRPTLGVKMPPTGQEVNKPEWGTIENIHLDMNPWRYVANGNKSEDKRVRNTDKLSHFRYSNRADFIAENNEVDNDEVSVQALVNFHDNREEDGGFQLIPSFKHVLEKWAKENADLQKRYREQTFIILPSRLDIHKYAMRITMRAGSLLIWDQRTVHGSKPNESNRARYCQFMKMFPNIADRQPKRAANRAKALKQRIEECGFTEHLTPLGTKLFGLNHA